MSDQPSIAPEIRKQLLAVIALAALLAIALGAVYLYLSTARQAQTLTLEAGTRLSSQSELLIRPLILSNDRVSLNFLLNELTASEQLSGVQIQDNQGIVIARSGSVSDLKLSKHLQQQERTIATMTLWLNPDSIAQQLRSQHLPMLILALIGSLMILLLTVWVTRKTRQKDDEALADFQNTDFQNHANLDNSFSAELAEQSQHYQQSYDQQLSDPQSKQQQSSDTDKELHQQDVFAPEPSIDKTYETQRNDTLEPAAEPIASTLEPTETASTQPQKQIQTDPLVDLLKPEPESTPLMPKFEHQPQDLTPGQPPAQDKTDTAAFELQEQEIDTHAEETAPAVASNSENPLFKLDSRKEVQLDLYSFEHELELILQPQEAIYLCYIDTHTASSDNIKEAEKQALVKVYLKLAKQVAHIYNGACEQLDNQDILLRFELRDDQDRHGINALCAAMLFSLLYQGFNQARIRSLQPVLSLHMSLARGHHGKQELVKEEAHFLTRTTNSNDLISHTALTEAPLIKQAVLSAADIRREDEDKVLLLKLTSKHQALLQKQANHLLTKLFRKTQTNQ